MPEYGLPDDRKSPFLPPENPGPESPLSSDPSVFDEPWMKSITHPGVSAEPAKQDESYVPVTDADHSVWDEPGLSRVLSGEMPAGAITWYAHYCQQYRATSPFSSWLTTMMVALFSGPFAIPGVFLLGGNASGLLMAVVIGPTAEEMMKIALSLWVVERRPWLFRSPIQILACCFAAGVTFAAVENVFYLNIYLSDPSSELIQWRWTICVLLHSSCSLLAGFGVTRMWRRFQTVQRRPDIADAATAILAAIVMHGSYNGFVLLLELYEIMF